MKNGNLKKYIIFVNAALFLTAGIWSASCSRQNDWNTYRGENGAGYISSEMRTPIGLRWKLSLQESTDQAKSFNPPVMLGDDIYFGSSDKNFYSLNMKSGYMNWIFKTKAAVNSVPFADDKNVYFGSNDGFVYAVNRKSGKEVWSFRTESTVKSLVLKYEKYVIFTSDTGSTYFLDENGKLLHRIPNPVWAHHTFQVYDGIVYWAPRGRDFGAYDIENRRFLWILDIDVPYPAWYSFPALDEDTVYYASAFLVNGPSLLSYYAVDRRTGQKIWTAQDTMDMGIRTPVTRDTVFMRHIDLLDFMAPVVWKDLVIFTSGDTVVRAFDKRTGNTVWTTKLPYTASSAPVAAGNRIYFGMRGDDDDGTGIKGNPPQLMALNAADGSQAWSMETEGNILSAPVVAGGRMLFGTDAHKFYVLEEIFRTGF